MSLLLLGPLAGAQLALPVKVNCGDLNGKPANEPGYLLMTQTSAPAGMSLSPAPVDTVHVGQTTWPAEYVWDTDVISIDPDQLWQTHRFTALQLKDDTVLEVGGLAPGELYRVQLELGTLYPWVDLVGSTFTGLPSISRQVEVETWDPSSPTAWRLVAKDLRCTTGIAGATMASAFAGQVKLWVLAESDGTGRIKLRFATAGSDPVFLAGFEVHEHESLPVLYKRTAAGPLQAKTPGVVPFVTQFNAGNYDAAEALAMSIANPFERGVALLHLAGWIDGSRDGRFHLLPAADLALSQASAHAAAPVLRQQIAQLDRALAHLAARAYDWAAECPSEGGYGFLNTECGPNLTYAQMGQSTANVQAHIALRELSGLVAPTTGDTVLDSLAQWNAGTLSASTWEPSPLVFAAAKLYGKTIGAMNPQLAVKASDPEAVELLERMRDIFGDFVDLGFHAADFEKDLELKLYDAYAASGSHPKSWPAEDVAALFTDAQIAASWWGDEVAVPANVPGAPPWANAQRQFGEVYRAAVDYWVESRLVAGELGGGSGDDVELLLQIFPLVGGLQETSDRRRLDLLHSVVERTLAQPIMESGYYGGAMADVEHSAEYTTNTFMATRAAFGHVAEAARLGFDVGRHLENQADPQLAFTGNSVLGRRHFKSFKFTGAEGPDDSASFALDVLLNGRAMQPAVATALHAPLGPGHPLLADLRDWATGWRTDALDPPTATNGKPVGFLAPAQWPSNEIGVEGVWYSETGEADDLALWEQGDTSYVLELLRCAYHSSSAGDRWKFLLPAVRMFRAVEAWEEQGEPSAAAGSEHWAAKQFEASPRFGPAVVSYLEDLAKDSTLNATPDPKLGNATSYVDDELLERMRAWVEDEWDHGQGPGTKYALGETQPCAEHQTKSTIGLENAYLAAVDFYRACFPLLTTGVLHTDRVFLSQGGGMSQGLRDATGVQLTEGIPIMPLARWIGPLEQDLDLALLNNARDYASTVYGAFAYNFDAQPRTLELQLDEGLVPGRYRVETGPGAANCDLFAGAPLTSKTIDKPGKGVALAVTLSPGLNLVRATRIANCPAAQDWDLCAGTPRVAVHPSGAGYELSVRVEVVNAGSAPSPSAQLRLFGAAILPNGEPVPLGSLPPEVEVHLATVPPLAASSSWTLPTHEIELVVPGSKLVSDLFAYGLGLQIRAEVTPGSLESDANNNGVSRSFFVADLDLAQL